jgi:hypothetical protein
MGGLLNCAAERIVAYLHAHVLPPMFDGGNPKFAAQVAEALRSAAQADADLDALLYRGGAG